MGKIGGAKKSAAKTKAAQSNAKLPRTRKHVKRLKFGEPANITRNMSSIAVIAGDVEVGEIILGSDKKYGIDWKIELAKTSDARCANFETYEAAAKFANALWGRFVISVIYPASESTKKEKK